MTSSVGKHFQEEAALAVPHLRRSAMFRTCVPALPGWAYVWRVGPPGLESGCERKGDASIKSSRSAEAVVIFLGGPKAHDSVEKRFREKRVEQQVPPLRYASVGMTIPWVIGKTADPSASLGMTKGRVALP
jgi:hypothetical protein